MEVIAKLLSWVWMPVALLLNAIGDGLRALAPTFFAHQGADFTSILLLLTLVTGELWLLDRFVLEKRRKAAAALQGTAPAKAGWLVDFGREFFPIIAIIFLLRAFVVEPFRIPSGSMIPTLRVGDFILVNRFAYGLRCPVGNCELLALDSPQRGDVVVFRYPVEPRQDFIKRVVGLPGDSIRYVNKELTVNGERARVQPLGRFEQEMLQWQRETLNGISHETLTNPERPADDFEFTVPDGQYFMMGDNRDGSSDSRFWGTVPEHYLKGRAFLVWMSWDGGPVLSRIGNVIR